MVVTGCWSDYEPCTPDDPYIYDDVIFKDGQFLDPNNGRPYANVGDRPFEGCTEIFGRVVLRGTLSDFSDFDDIEAIAGFLDDGVVLPSIEATTCGRVRGFPKLKYITFIWQEGTEDPGYPCLYLDGFESLQFVEGRLLCSQVSPNVPGQLIAVTGELMCWPNSRLVNLERVGRLTLDGTPVPRLRIAESLAPIEIIQGAMFDFPSLEEVRKGPSGNGGLRLVGPGPVSVNLPRLTSVEGELFLAGAYWGVDLPVPDEERGEYVRSLFAHVDVQGPRTICMSGLNDPCPWEETCASVHGDMSPLCCTDDWPVCTAE